jgi:serine/threonine protein kinase
MDPERWQEIDKLLSEALKRESGQREDFLKQACAGDEELLKEVAPLLSAHEKPGSFMESPALDVTAPALAKDKTNPPPMVLTGRAIAHFRILEKIGQGGMGEIFLAEDTSHRRKVALKFLSPELQQDPIARKRFIREARATAALDHPYICHINEVAECEGKDFIVMEYVEGQTLKERLDQGLLSQKEALSIVIEVAEALEEAHGKGIIHRDLKPANIMLTRGSHAKVMDFGWRSS